LLTPFAGWFYFAIVRKTPAYCSSISLKNILISKPLFKK
jgi:hypothetical protein